MANQSDILDDVNFIDHLMIGEPIWSDVPNLRSLISIRKTVTDIFLFITMTIALVLLIVNIYENTAWTGMLQFWTFFIGIIYVILIVVRAFEIKKIKIDSESTYYMSKTHVAQIHQSGKVIQKSPLSHIYQVIVEEKKSELGHVHMMIKDKEPSKKQRITVSNKMMNPSFSFKGIINFKTVAQELVDNRNIAIEELQKD